MFKPSGKVDPSRGFVSAKTKVPKPHHIDGTGSESDLIKGIASKFDQPIHKSTSEWVLSSSPEARPFQGKKKKNRYRKNEPIYDTPSLPSLADLEMPATRANEHYYSIPTDESNAAKMVPMKGNRGPNWKLWYPHTEAPLGLIFRLNKL